MCVVYHGITFIPKKIGLFEPNFKLEFFFPHRPNKTIYSNVRQQIRPIGKYNMFGFEFNFGLDFYYKMGLRHVIFPNRTNLVAITKIRPKGFTLGIRVEK